LATTGIEPFQDRAWSALCGTATHVLLYGGAGSGKTHLVMLWLVLRALAKPKATHAIFRFHFNHLKASIIYGTLPAACEARWPGRKLYELNKTDWYAEFVGGGRVYFGGLEDKVRTEKVLGQEHSSIFCNEASQIGHDAWLKASTRLRQQSGLRLKMVCDENPPIAGHWTELMWLRGLEPSTRARLAGAEHYAVEKMNPADNPHIPESYKIQLQSLPPRARERFWLGNFGSGIASPLWTYESIERARVEAPPPDLGEIVVSVDPSGCSGPEDTRSDEVGLVVAGLSASRAVYILEDASEHYGPSGQEGWGAKLIELVVKWGADRVVAETNFGGAMVEAVLRAATWTAPGGKVYRGDGIPFRGLTASRAKHVRAEPVATLTDEGRVKFVGSFPELEQQLQGFSTAGYQGERSPDRADAMVWAVDALGITPTSNWGLFDYYIAEGAKASGTHTNGGDTTAAPSDPAALVELIAPPHVAGTFYSREGAVYQVESGRVRAKPQDVDDLQSSGFRPA
jgi:hypothetical protein